MWWVELLNSFVSVLDSGGAGGGAGAYESIATIIASSAATTITFSSIPSTYKHLQVRWIANTYNATSNEGLYIQFNGDTAANYSWHALNGDGSGAYSNGAANVTYPCLTAAVLPATGTTYGVGILDVQDYSVTTKNKTARMIAGRDTNGATTQTINLSSGAWFNTAAITSLSFRTGTGFSNTSIFSLYGIKGA
jgi:hypothetical protein